MAQPNQVTLDIGEEDPVEVTPRQSALHRVDSLREPRQATPNRNNLGLGDRLNSVFREIRPLVEHARMGNNARLSLPTWLPRHAPGTHHLPGDVNLQRPQSTIAHVNLGPNSQTFIINERVVVSTSNPVNTSAPGNESSLSDQSEDHPEINLSVNPANNNNIHDSGDNESQSDDGTHQVVDVRATLTLLIRYAPFYFILFIKFLYDCREGIFTFLVLFCTFSHSNGLVRREHGKQMNRSISLLFCELLFTLSSIVIIHFVFGHEKLLNNVVMFPNYTELDIWELLWLVLCTDLVVKIITVDVKLIVTMMPAFILPFQKRGKVYLFTETVSQLYRSLLTIQPWLFYLLSSYSGSERVVGMFLSAMYSGAKLFELLLKLRLVKNATWTLLQSVNLGTKPTCEQLLLAGDSCPICHDDYTTPVRLGCSHIFCELCISAWLDREHTCPLCRAKVADEPTWRDGSTTYDFQLH